MKFTVCSCFRFCAANEDLRGQGFSTLFDRRVCTATQFARRYGLPRFVPGVAHGAAPPTAEEQGSKRFGYYQSFACEVMKARGAGDRKRIPKCMKRLIRHAYPDPNGNYTGHKES